MTEQARSKVERGPAGLRVNCPVCGLGSKNYGDDGREADLQATTHDWSVHDNWWDRSAAYAALERYQAEQARAAQ